MTSRQIRTIKKTSVLLLKQPFFQLFNFDDSSFWNQWEFRDVMYLILKVKLCFILDLRSSRACHCFYFPPPPKEKGHFTPKTSYCPIWFAPHCIGQFLIDFIDVKCHYGYFWLLWYVKLWILSKNHTFRGVTLAPPNGPKSKPIPHCAGVPWVNPGGRPQEWGGDSKAI